MGYARDKISLPYDVRVRRYEAEKKLLMSAGLPAAEYEQAVKDLARKWRI